MTTMWKKLFIIAGGLVVAGAVIGGGLYLAFPVQVSTMGGVSRNYLTTLNSPAGTVSTETNAAYQSPVAAVPSVPADPTSSNAATEDWPSYNRTVSSQRYSQLSQITTKNVGQLKVVCTYDTHQLAAFESGLIMVNNALIGTTEFDIFSLDPATCAVNWRTHEDYPPSLLPSNRGAAYLEGMLFRGTQDGRLLAYDFKTGKRLWQTTIADTKLGESVPSAPIAYDGLVFVGNSGGDFKGGKGHIYALDTKTGHLYVPGGNPAPDFVQGGLDAANAREGGNLYSDSVVVLDSKTGDYKNHFKLVPHDWHDYDVSNPPVPIQSMGGKQILVVAPKDGHLYAYDLANSSLLYRVPVNKIENADVAFTPGKSVHFCPGPVGGDEWNSPAYVPETNLILLGQVDWCYSVTVKDDKQLREMALGQPWTGMHALNPFNMFGDPARRADGGWGGWVYAVDADTGVWKWRLRSNYPVVAGITPTAGGVVFFGDVGGNFYALDAANGEKLFGRQLGGAIGGGVITYTANGAQKVAVAYGFTMLAWPVKIVTAKVAIIGLDSASANP